MLNETLNQELTYESVTNITQHPIFIICLIIVWASIWISYLIIGSCVRGKTSSGVKLKDLMIYSANFWYGFFLMFFFQLALILILIVFPVWLNLI